MKVRLCSSTTTTAAIFRIAALTLLALTFCHAAWAGGPADDSVFASGVTALEKGAHDDAVDQFEILADRGVAHPDASYNRGLAYAQRARSSGARPGDLGQAAAAFEEVLVLRPDDPEAPQALLLVRDELARTRSRRSAVDVRSEQTFPQAIVSLLPEWIWALLTLLGSLTLAGGLLARRILRTDAGRLSAATASWVGGAVFAIGLSATLLAARDRSQFDPAVTIAKDAKLLDDLGRPLTGVSTQARSLPEGTRVDVGEHRGRLTRVRWGGAKGWILSVQLRPLAQGSAQP